eukprot:4611887-Pleurochrysis_carterae.AAC.2
MPAAARARTPTAAHTIARAHARTNSRTRRRTLMLGNGSQFSSCDTYSSSPALRIPYPSFLHLSPCFCTLLKLLEELPLQLQLAPCYSATSTRDRKASNYLRSAKKEASGCTV